MCLFSLFYLLNYIYISMDLGIYVIFWVVIQGCFIYSVAQSVPASAIRSSFSWFCVTFTYPCHYIVVSVIVVILSPSFILSTERCSRFFCIFFTPFLAWVIFRGVMILLFLKNGINNQHLGVRFLVTSRVSVVHVLSGDRSWKCVCTVLCIYRYL